MPILILHLINPHSEVSRMPIRLSDLGLAMPYNSAILTRLQTGHSISAAQFAGVRLMLLNLCLVYFDAKKGFFWLPHRQVFSLLVVHVFHISFVLIYFIICLSEVCRSSLLFTSRTINIIVQNVVKIKIQLIFLEAKNINFFFNDFLMWLPQWRQLF